MIQPPEPFTVLNTTSSISNYSCVAKAGWGAKVKWINSSGDVIPEHDPNDINLPSIYVTYSMNNVSTVLTAKNTSYTGDPINSVYPVHTATLHFNGTPYHDQNRSFTCFITGVNVQFLHKYNVSGNNLAYSMTVYVPKAVTTTSSSSSSSSSGLTAVSIILTIIGAILLLIIIISMSIFCYKKYGQQSQSIPLSIQTPFSQFTAESAIDSTIIGEKVQFPREKITLLQVLGKLYVALLYCIIYCC